MANKWTEAELAALDTTTDASMGEYHKFGALTGYSKSYNAFEVKRRRVTETSPATVSALDLGASVAPVAPGVTREEIADYVGFNLAFWDLETTFSTQPIVLFGASADQFGRVTEFRKGKDITDDKDLVKRIRDHLVEQDIWFTWNGKLFDVPVLNGRLIFHGLEPLPPRMHVDLMYKATGGSVRIGRRSLQSVSEYFGVHNRKTPLTVRVWDKAMAGSEEAYDLIAEHGHADVLVTRDVFNVLKPQIGNVQR
jgi:uncharacterized protein YprB with RNaseH-like and TPR domain